MANMDASATASVMEQMGTPARQLIHAIQRLEALNIDATLESVPKFVVIGDQSAGKSSVIEAICDIQLPRNEGTCTRCPYQISTTSSGPDGSWSCKISIVKKYAYRPEIRAGHNGASFNRWGDQETQVFEFVTLHSKQDLEVALCRAQLAVLNPHQDPQSFRNVPIKRGHVHAQKVGFSPNIISLDIAAPNLPDLSFYDLPGAINTMGDESQEFLVEFVETLLKRYIQDEEAHIVLACAANQDLEVSTALRFLRQCKATQRALGVLTKPDLVDATPGKIKFFDDLLHGKQYKLGGGWFVTRQLSQKELNGEHALTHEQARQIEANFFAAGAWSTTLGAYANRFGIPNLQHCISRELTDDIVRKLPTIVARVQGRLSSLNDELAMFPEQAAPQTASLTVITEIDRVKTAIIAQINADSNISTFRNDYREMYRNLGKRLRNLKPEVVWVTPGYTKPSIAVDSDEEEGTPCKRSRTNNGHRAVSAAPGSSGRAVRRTPASSSSSQQTSSRPGKTIFRLNEVKKRFDSSPGGDIPDQVSDSVVKSLSVEPVAAWGNLTNGLIKQIRTAFSQMLENAINNSLAQRSTTELYRRTVEITNALFEEHLQEVTDFVCRLVASECHRAMTYNPLISQKRAAYETENLRLRREQRVEEYFETLDAEGRKVPNIPEQKKKADDIAWVTANLGIDQYEREVKALATPLAYYEIASAGLVDTIAKQFECGLMYSYEDRLQRKLLEELRATTDPEYCVSLLAEDPEREARREELLAERVKLEKALAELKALPGAHT